VFALRRGADPIRIYSKEKTPEILAGIGVGYTEKVAFGVQKL